MHIMFIGAHPDDETYVSGTLAKYIELGHKATIVQATRGGKGHWEIPTSKLEKIRTNEMKKAAEVIGADVRFLEFPDAGVPFGDELRETLVDVFRVLKPDILLTFHPLVWRDDHRRVGQAASDASLKASLPLHKTIYPAHRSEPEIFFIGTTMVHQEPDVYIDVTDYIDVKVESFKKHSSQWQEWGKPSKDQGEYLEKLVDMYVHRFREYGRRCGVKYAEAYISKSRLAYAHDLLPVKR